MRTNIWGIPNHTIHCSNIPLRFMAHLLRKYAIAPTNVDQHSACSRKIGGQRDGGMQAYSASLRGKFASQTLPPPYGVTFYSVHTRDNLFPANISIQTSLATSLHFSAGEFVYHKNRRWRSSPTVFFVKICSFIIYAQHFIY